MASSAVRIPARFALWGALALPAVGACATSSNPGDAMATDPPHRAGEATATPPQTPEQVTLGAETPPPSSGERFTGVVAEHFPAAGYTYLRIDGDDGRAFWAAIEEQPLQTGQHVALRISTPMHNFTSRTLNRTFAVILFATLDDAPGEPHASPPEGGPGYLEL